jgi:diguanylate cyclase (GGDEF)-like protein/PAS domain S-box-containing protein
MIKDQPRLLLVEDDEDDYLLTRDMLTEIQSTAYAVDWAATYEVGLEAIGRHEHDVYLLDYRLGAHTGLELVQAIVAGGAAAPGILLTGQDDRRIDVEAMEAGAADYLLKGEITPALLERAIRYARQHAQAQVALQQSERRFRTLIDHSFDGIVLIGPTGMVQFVSPSMRTILGYAEEDLVGSRPLDLVHPDDLGPLASAPGTLLERPGKAIHAEVRVRHSDGRYRWLEVVATNLLQEPGVDAVVLNIRDSTERKHLEERLVHQALHDPLTDLPNHGALVEALTMDLARASRFHRHCAVLFLDIDHFKAINDTCGHQDGDAVLWGFAALIRSNLSATDTIGRWGGEEFMAVLPETDLAAALLVAERLRLAVAAYRFPAGGGRQVTCSIGVAVFPEDGKIREDLIGAADRALYAAKRLGRDQVRAVSDPTTRSLLLAGNDSMPARSGAALAALQRWLATSPWSIADQSIILTAVGAVVGELPDVVLPS